jgi:hypothetical protein
MDYAPITHRNKKKIEVQRFSDIQICCTQCGQSYPLGQLYNNHPSHLTFKSAVRTPFHKLMPSLYIHVMKICGNINKAKSEQAVICV